MTRYLSVEELIVIAEEAIAGAQVAVRDHGLLESAAHRPGATVFGAEAYSSLLDKAAALLHSLVNNHPLIDGNRRLGWLATATFLELNDLELTHTEDEAYALVMDVAKGTLTEVGDIATRLAAFTG
ncbi:MAG: type II toxin-antitoxin system death-on-curing family toxin [Egibacteraceae bacterium]